MAGGKSFFTKWETLEEIDTLLERARRRQRLGTPERQCGWLKEKFGVCWQVIPNAQRALPQCEDLAP